MSFMESMKHEMLDNYNTAYTETLTPTKTAESSDMKEVFTKFTNKDGEVLSTITGSDSLDAVEIYFASLLAFFKSNFDDSVK